MTNHVIPGEVYAWTAVLVLPINSALNPFLYTLSAILGKGVSKVNHQLDRKTTDTLGLNIRSRHRLFSANINVAIPNLVRQTRFLYLTSSVSLNPNSLKEKCDW